MNEVRLVEPRESLPAPVASAPMQLIQLAMERGQLDQIDKLLDLQQRWEANEARKAYVAAMARCKAEPITVMKDKTVSFPTKSGGPTTYRHATLAAVVDAVVSRMGRFGLSHSWDIKQSEGHVTVSCIITHELGHSESVTMVGPRDDSGSKNLSQQIGSTSTYLQRYTLMAAFGLAAKDSDDDDGASTGDQEPTGQQQGGLDPRGNLGKNADRPKAGAYADRFLKAMNADKEEVDIAAEVYKIHMEVCNDDELYVAITRLMAPNYRNAIGKYVAIHKKETGK